MTEKKDGRERNITQPMLIERPSTKMLAVGGPPPPPAPSKPTPRSTTKTLMGVPYTPPIAPPASSPSRTSRSFKRPSDSTPPSAPLIDLSDLFLTEAPKIQPIPPVLLPPVPLGRRERFIAWLRRSRWTRWIARLLVG